MGVHAYSANNIANGLAATAFVWSNGAVTNRAYLNDGRMDRQELIDAAAASGINVIVDFGAPVTPVGFAVLNSNPGVQKTDATLKVEASSASDFSSDVNVAKAASTLYSTIAPRNKDHVVQFTNTFTKRYWRLTWTWTGTVANFKIGELWAYTAATQLSRRTIYGGYAERRKMFTRVEQFDMGERRGLKLGGPQRALQLTWSDLTIAQRDEIDALWAAANADVTPFLWINSYEATAVAAATSEQDCIFGRLEQNEMHYPEDDFQLIGTGGLGFTLFSAGREVGA